MEGSSIAIYCPNPACKTPNPEHHPFCQQCRTPVPNRYLWIAGEVAPAELIGQRLGDRYWLKTSSIALDTQPGLPPEAPEEVPPAIEPYLRLFHYNLHIPQPYALVSHNEQAWLLLEQAPLHSDGLTIQPTLQSQWAQVHALRQLNWLWQVAQLWQPLLQEGVASTLLEPELLRVSGSLVQLLELQPDRVVGLSPNLQHLGQAWSQLLPAHSSISQFLEALCLQMIQGQIRTIEAVITQLDYAIQVCGKQQVSQVQLFCLSDRGPNRQKNEDACYPESGSQAQFKLEEQTTEQPLLIVCDGIGGHEGGDVASKMAIASMAQQVQTLLANTTHPYPSELKLGLEKAARIANDLIAQRNDREHRQERQRMGTTVVMALPLAHEIYLTHVGDSRAYWITQQTCRQITVDDDFASRETRMGYIFYRDALQNPVAGALIQALGMGQSGNLYPSTRRLIIDEDCVFLLCSDGLSDFDRVETFWGTTIRPILQGELDVKLAGQRLVELANHWNGHDNVTIGLIHYRVSPAQTPQTLISNLSQSQLQQQSSSPDELVATRQTQPIDSRQLDLKQQRHSPTIPRETQSSFWSRLFPLGLLTILGIGGLAIFFANPPNEWFKNQSPRITSSSGLSDRPSPLPTSTSANSPGAPITVGSLVLITTPNNASSNHSVPLTLLSQPGASELSPTNSTNPAVTTPTVGPLMPGTILKILKRQEVTSQQYWLQLQVCSIPPNLPLTPNSSLQPGVLGWIQETDLALYATVTANIAPERLVGCQPLPSNPSP